MKLECIRRLDRALPVYCVSGGRSVRLWQPLSLPWSCSPRQYQRPWPGRLTTAAVSISGGQQGSRLLRLGLKKSAVLKLPATAKDVIVGDTSLVDVVLKNRDTAYLFARNAGQTNIFFLDATGRQILQLDLEVTLDTKALKELIDRSIPGNSIKVDSTGANVVLKGAVADAQQGKTAEDLAKRFMSGNGAGDDSVLNLLTIAEGNQVMLKVRVVELSEPFSKSSEGTLRFDHRWDVQVRFR